ncbi:MAG TPA: hypothetical protein EYP65_06675 [Armatimonadetes bacterium]|nr:hypothetical protein [Armatimonadota bacterium]
MAPKLERLRHWMARESELVVAVFRTTIVFLAAIWPLVKGQPIDWRWSAVVCGAGAYSVALILAIRRGAPSILLRPIALVGDIAFITLLLQMAGGKAARLFPLYLLVIVVAAAWFGVLGALIAAAVSIMLGIGIFMIGSPSPAEAFSEAVSMLGLDIFFLIAAALFMGYVSEAMERERRARAGMEEEFRLAREFHRDLLPSRIPEVEGLEIAVKFLPASYGVGGDYYEVFVRPDGGVVICVADASGKGMVGQMRLALVRHALREVVSKVGSPSRALKDLNEALLPDLAPEGLVSIFLAFVDRGRSSLRCASAGSPPALLRRADTGEVEEISPYGPPIGASVEEGFEEKRIEVRPGDLLCIYTDGMLVEGDVFEAVEGLKRILREAQTDSVEGMVESIGSKVGRKPEDDVTLMLCRFRSRGEGGKG